MRPLRRAIQPSGAPWIIHLIVMIVLMLACAAGGLFGCCAAWKTYLQELDHFLAELYAHGFAQMNQPPPKSMTSYQ